MTKLKVTDLQSVEVAKEDVVEAGQVRKSEISGTIVLIIHAPRGGFHAVKLDEGHWQFKVNDATRPESASEIKSSFPILLDAELTYKEVE